MVGAKRLGEYAWACENLLNRVIDHTLPISDGLIEMVGHAIKASEELLQQFRDGAEPSADIAGMMARLHDVARGDLRLDEAETEEVTDVVPDEAATSVIEAQEEAVQPAVSESGEPEVGAQSAPVEFESESIEVAASGVDESLAEEPVAEPTVASGEDELPEEAVASPVPRIDPVLYEIYFNETQAHLKSLHEWLQAVSQDSKAPITFELQRAVHTLLGSARMAEVDSVSDVLKPLDRLVKLAEAEHWPGSRLSTEIEAASAATEVLVEAYGDSERPLPDYTALRDQFEALLDEHDQEQADEFALETETSPAVAADNEAETAEVMESVAEDEPAMDTPVDDVQEEQVDETGNQEEISEQPVAKPAEAPKPVSRPAIKPAQAVSVINLASLEGYDPSLAEVFLVEAGELLEGADGSVHSWAQDHDQTEPLTDLLRRLHTLKGGARMVGLSPLADMSHELESLLVRVADGRVAVSGDLLRLIERAFDRLHRMLEHAAGDGQVPFDTAVLMELQRHTGSASIYEEDEEAGEEEREIQEQSSAVANEPAAGHGQGQEQKQASAGQTAETVEAEDEEERRVVPRLRHEMARVRADLLETSINNAGELSIFRSRVEQQLVNMNLNLAELDRTVERVHTQLRELDIETEAQILSEHRTETVTEGFDPLEFDRYTRLHELSRSLAEAVSDLSSLRSLLASELQQANVLLERQGRVNGDLQDALMRTRMVPFSLSSSRLRRIVRNTAEESGKHAELKLKGVEGEMDRQVLEHILPALEHLLRNAVVHGIEDAKTRHSHGKSEIGQIELRLRREGADMIIEVQDDGGGLDLKAIRAKAEKEQIIEKGAELSERELTELVFRPGFSTASTLTQSAGRGVGMDVVAAEARQVGGTVEVESTPFEGACWRLRLPVTLAITQTLLIRIGKTLYPVPLASLSGIQRIQRSELEALMAMDEPEYEYGGNSYRMLSLTRLLGEEVLSAEEEAPRIPLLLVDVGGRHVALIADDLEGNREVVVKPVGPQVAHVPGISGATIFGDGSIGLLLDLASLVRSLPQIEGQDLPAAHAPSPSGLAAVAPLVMVVDDSITVRRVTQRLLERRGARVLTAKDGVEALEQLQDHKPDVMLLDIEMPRFASAQHTYHCDHVPNGREASCSCRPDRH
jgi:chemosensory pili system protein ChpA (sensor histidine kinase/response regulator)